MSKPILGQLQEQLLAGQTLREALATEARAIKAIGDDRREKTYAAKNDMGYVTAKIYPVVKGPRR